MQTTLNRALAGGLVALCLAGCSTDNTIIKGQTHRGTTSGVAAASTSGTTASSTTTGTTTTSSSSSSSSSSTTTTSSTSGSVVHCPNLAVDDAGPLNDCPAGQLELLGQATNYCQQGAPISSGLSVSDMYQPSLSIKADPCGIFHTCTQPGSDLLINLDSSSFALTSVPILAPTQSTVLATPVVLVCNQIFDGLLNEISTFAPYDPDGGALWVIMQSLDQPPSRCADLSGFQFRIFDDAGVEMTGTKVFLTTIGADPSATSTSVIGVEVIFNLDTRRGLATVQMVDTQADGGASACTGYPALPPFTNELPLEQGRFTDVFWPIY